jgi:hypothetical protein
MKFFADTHNYKDPDVMHTPLLMLEIQANALEQERRNTQLMNEQLRLARRNDRNSVAQALVVLRHMLGVVLISVGERLLPEPADRPDGAKTPMNA